MDTAQQLTSYTIEDIYALPEGQRAELIDGKLYMMAPPKTKHQKISYWLSFEIGNYIRSKNGTCMVFPAPFAVFLNKDNSVYVEPDISVICDKDKLDEDGCKGAPDWIIEIVSKSSHTMDYYTKLFQYHSAGVREYWIVDADRNHITVHNFENESIQDYSFTETVKAGIYEDFEIDFSQLEL